MQSAPPSRPELGSRHRFLLRLEKFSRSRYGWVFLAALLVAAVGSFLGSRLTVDSDILALIPPGNQQVDSFKEAVTDFGSISYLVALLEAGERAGPDELEDFADLLAANLLKLDAMVELVEHKLDPGADFLDLFYDNALLYLHPERLGELEARLGDGAILSQIEQNRLSLSSPTAAFTQELMVNDPLNLMPLLFRPSGNLGNLRVDLTDGYYLSQDGQSLIVLVKPTQPWQNIEFDQRLMEAVQRIERETREQFEREAHEAGGEFGEIKVRYTGRYAIAVDEAGLVRQDVKFNLLCSLFAVSVLYWLCYRRFAALLYSSVPLLVGQAMTFGLAYFLFLMPWISGSKGLNAASSAFTALLMGLGTDFVIVMYARYVEERRQGRTLGEATERMVGETGLGVFTGAITSAGTFYAMCISEFRGLRDLGFLIGTGILLCAVAIIFLVPAMIKWNEGVRKRKVESIEKLYVQSFLLEHLLPFSARFRYGVIVVIVVLTLASAYVSVSGFIIPGWPTLEFDDTVQVLRSNRSEAYRVQQDMADTFGASLSYMMAIVVAPTEKQAIDLAEAIATRLQPYLDDGTVASYNSILSYLPPISQQRHILQARDAGRDDAFDTSRIRATFVRGLDENGFESEPFEAFLDRMERFLAPERPIGLTDLELHGLRSLIERYVRRTEDGIRIVTYLSLSDPRWKREPPPGLAEDLSAGDDGIVVTGTNVVSREFRRIFTQEAPRALLLGLGVVFALLIIDFRSLKLTSIALGQLICGVLLMLGVMKLVDVHLNYVNAFVATMILGVGIDYSIHLIHRMSLTGGKVDRALLETGKAVVIAALTNIAAFGTLMAGSYPALRSFGVVAVIGSLTCLFTALTLVPAIMVGRDRGQTTK
jgi:predicted RND superfamily exporter protein